MVKTSLHLSPLQRVTAIASALCLLLAIVQVLDQSKYVRVLEQVRTQKLGADQDWDVKKWSTKHVHNVGQAKLDKATVKNIWHSKHQAWAGIDDILPTGGRYAYEENHQLTADQVHMMDYVKYAHQQVSAMEKALPKIVPASLKKEVSQAKQVLATDEARLNLIAHQTPEVSKRSAKAASPQMLAEQHKAARVYLDDALYGEGISGDIKSQGHHKAHWSAKGAEDDMAQYFSKLATATAKQAAASHGGLGPYHTTDQRMSSYYTYLKARSDAQEMIHIRILKQDGYFATHPSEHQDMAKFIAQSYAGGKSQSNTAAPTPNLQMIRDAWVHKNGEPKTEAQLLALQQYEQHAEEVLRKADAALLESLV